MISLRLETCYVFFFSKSVIFSWFVSKVTQKPKLNKCHFWDACQVILYILILLRFIRNVCKLQKVSDILSKIPKSDCSNLPFLMYWLYRMQFTILLVNLVFSWSWLKDGTTRFPMQVANSLCLSQTGIITQHPSSKYSRHDAMCYKP